MHAIAVYLARARSLFVHNIDVKYLEIQKATEGIEIERMINSSIPTYLKHLTAQQKWSVYIQTKDPVQSVGSSALAMPV